MAAADDLYALPPEEFTAARDAAARQARDQDRALAAALKALRRPTVPAWLVNVLVRREPALVGQLLELGAGLAEAQRAGQGDALRALGDQRRALVEAVTDRAVALGGRPVTAAVRAEVAGTLEAALADGPSGAAVRSGRLTRALSYAGFGGVDLADAVADALPDGVGAAAPGPGPDRGRATRQEEVAEQEVVAQAASERVEQAVVEQAAAEREASEREASEREAARRAQHEAARRQRLREAESAALDAQGALDDAGRAWERATRRDERTREQERAAQDAVTGLEARLAEARERLETAQGEAGRTAAAADQAQERVARAQEAAERTRAELDRLRRPEGPA